MLKTITLAALILISSCSFSDDFADKLDKLMAEYDKQELFSGAVLLTKDGSPVFEKTYGYSDWEKKTPVTSSTLFNICSLNKMYTHTMILQLQKEGKLNVSDPLNKYLQLYPDETGSKITIQMLIEMKAGLNDYTRNPEFNQHPEKFKTVNDFLQIIKDEPLLFEPGTGWEYSNSGYVVLGGVVEKITGKSYTDNLKERFFEPLGIKNAYFRQIGDNVPNCAKGTIIKYDGTKRNEVIRVSPSPAGGLYMNAEDMMKFDNYLKTANLLPPGIRAGGSEAWNSIFAQYKNGYTLLITSNFSHAAEQVEMRFGDIIAGKDYPPPALPFSMKLYKVLKEKGIEYIEQNLKSMVEKEDMEYRPFHLNMFGYELMNNNELDPALEIFKLNVKLFPDVANVWDSLGEAYMNKGDKENAILNYKKVLELEPDNRNAKKQLEKLQGK